MGYIFSSTLLFFILLGLIAGFHGSGWDYGGSVTGLSRSWISGFECGFLCQRLVENYFSYTYFILLVFFVVFDLEVSLLLNMPFQGVFFKNLLFYLSFLFLLGVGFGVEINKGYVEWSY